VVVPDSPKITCGRTDARLDDANAFLRCNVRAKPKATSIFWILSGNGTTLKSDEVIDDCWTVIKVALLFSVYIGAKVLRKSGVIPAKGANGDCKVSVSRCGEVMLQNC